MKKSVLVAFFALVVCFIPVNMSAQDTTQVITLDTEKVSDLIAYVRKNGVEHYFDDAYKSSVHQYVLLPNQWRKAVTVGISNSEQFVEFKVDSANRMWISLNGQLQVIDGGSQVNGERRPGLTEYDLANLDQLLDDFALYTSPLFVEHKKAEEGNKEWNFLQVFIDGARAEPDAVFRYNVDVFINKTLQTVTTVKIKETRDALVVTLNIQGTQGETEEALVLKKGESLWKQLKKHKNKIFFQKIMHLYR